MSNRLRKGDKVPFAQISTDILFHPTLSLKAKGLYAYMYAKPDNWNFTSLSMAKQLKEGKRAILNILKELKEFGLLEYKKLSSGKGEYIIYSSPIEPKCQNSTLPKNSQSAVSAPCNNCTVQKEHRINNIDTNNYIEDINNTPISPRGSNGDYKKSFLGLEPEVAAYKKKVIEKNKETPLGHLGKYWVEDKEENVFIDKKGYLYTETRTTKQIVSSTIKELWTQIYELQKLMQNSDTARAIDTLQRLRG